MLQARLRRRLRGLTGRSRRARKQPDEIYLNLVLEFVPETIYRIIKHYSRSKRQVPTLYVKVRARPVPNLALVTTRRPRTNMRDPQRALPRRSPPLS